MAIDKRTIKQPSLAEAAHPTDSNIRIGGLDSTGLEISLVGHVQTHQHAEVFAGIRRGLDAINFVVDVESPAAESRH